jgi:replicative DNA helicase
LLYGSADQLLVWEKEAKDETAVIPTGYAAFDRYLKRGGLRRSHLAGLLGRSNVGKSGFLVNVASHMVRVGAPVLISTQEMSVAEMTNRLVAVHYELPVQEIEDWVKQDRLWALRNETYAEDFHRLEIFDDDEPTVAQLGDAARAYKAKHGATPVILQDFMELLSTEGMYGNEVVKVGRLARQLKALARDLDTSVFTLVQVGRSKEHDISARNHGHIPLSMEDARWAGEQAFDVMFGMYRPELDPDADNPMLLHGDKKEQERYELAQEKRLQYKNQAILQVVKNRFGPRNDAGHPVDIDWKTMRFLERQPLAAAA